MREVKGFFVLEVVRITDNRWEAWIDDKIIGEYSSAKGGKSAVKRQMKLQTRRRLDWFRVDFLGIVEKWFCNLDRERPED